MDASHAPARHLLSHGRWIVPGLAFVVLTAGITLAAATHLRGFQRDLRAHVERELATVADLKVRQIVEWRERVVRDAADLGQAPAATTLLEGVDPGATTARRHAALRRLEARLERQGFDLGAVVDDAGRVLLATHARGDAEGEELAAIREGIRLGRPTLVDLSSAGGAIRIVVPLLAADQPSLAVVLSGWVGASLPESVRAWPSQSNSAEAFLAAVHGDEVVILDALRFTGGVAYPPRFRLSGAQFPLALAARGIEGTGRHLDHRGEPVLAARRAIPNSNWVMSAKVNEREMLAPADERARSLSLAVAAILVASAAALVFWWRAERAELNRRERDLEERERVERLQYMWKHAHDAVIIADAEGRIVDANDRALELYGRDRAELLTQRLHDLRAPGERASLPAIWERVRNDPGGVLVETFHLRKDGTEVPVEVGVRRVRSDQRHFVYCIVRDISERRKTEREARVQDERLRLALDASEAGIADIDVAARTAQLSPRLATILSRPPGEASLDALQDTVHPDDRAVVEQRFRDLIDGTSERMVAEFRVIVDHGVAWHRLYARAVDRGADGTALRLVATVSDVTRERALQTQLAFSDRLASIGTLAAGVAHEINNPLSYLMANLEFLHEGLTNLRKGIAPPASLLDSVVEESREGVRRIAEIVQTLRTFSRRERDPGAPQPIDLRDPVRAALRIASNEIRSRARLVVELGDVPTVAAPEHELAQIAVNLLVNAAQAIPGGREREHTVTVRTRAEEGWAILEVEDTGVGIAPEHIGRIFDPFFTTKRVGEGTGLGLSVCLGIVEGLGGRIDVDSRPGAGSVFRVVLPCTDAAAAASKRASPARRRAAPARRGRVLVIDDDPLVGRAVARTLSPLHDVVALTNPVEAVERLGRGEEIDLVLCDLMMPGLSGMDCWRELRQRRPDLAESMIFLTGGAFTDSARSFLDEVTNPRIEKPFELDVLRSAVARALAI